MELYEAAWRPEFLLFARVGGIPGLLTALTQNFCLFLWSGDCFPKSTQIMLRIACSPSGYATFKIGYGGRNPDKTRGKAEWKRKPEGWGMEVDIKGEKTHRERRGDMSGCLQGGVIPSCKQVITSNCVLMRLHGEDNNKLWHWCIGLSYGCVHSLVFKEQRPEFTQTSGGLLHQHLLPSQSNELKYTSPKLF